MRVTFYGVRGSIATPGPSTVRYGGNTVCVAVRTVDNTLVVFDIGTGARVLGDELVAAGVLPAPIHVFVTHAHWDHIIGAPFFAPIYKKEGHVILHAMSPRAESSIAKGVLFDGEHFPVRIADLPARLERPPFAGETMRVGSATVRCIQLNHPGGCEGFRIDDADGSSVCYLTDNELTPPAGLVSAPTDLTRFASGTGLLIHDAQYMPEDMPAKRGWGHSVVDDVLALGRDAEARTVALHHHDPWRDDHALDLIAAHARAWCRVHAPAMSTLVASEGLTLDVKP
ncbi:MAG: Metal-dependent hydrolase of the beta-lactamase superfamily [Myxococcales bacterium]|nr:Metal-dependent hydrolase of the beta-lactamase superfamily [Myxococcales bacterium]